MKYFYDIENVNRKKLFGNNFGFVNELENKPLHM
jgi:hypothetical protein